ncbi:tyrosine-type recombinase/integrase [Prevotella denticola]|uniref:tyrosine-type recombinase/integrase n=1 Tax=Prevotella denticola TaxID=28129 RepID=UPI001BAD4BDF|nr:tyrosine-type recombinase/integrase [Prevotella denticola]QUB91410.1 tyrosine-type recombinase/integrase [Prevotella denticola]
MKQKDNITDMAMLLKDFFETYLLKERGVSNHTIRSYSATFQSLYAFFKDNKGIRANKLFVKDLSRRSINDYLNWLEMEKGNKVSTRNSRLASVKAFCHYAQYKDFKNLARWQDILSIKSKKADMPYMSFLTQEGMKTLLSEVPTDTIQGRRHLAILAFLYDTGARANELISFSAHNLNLTKPYHVILSGKGRKKRIVPIHEKLVLILKAYMKDANIELNNISKQPLFVNAYGRKLTSAGLTHIIMMYADKVRENFPALMPKRLSPHSFRHSKATHLLQAGMNIIYVRDFLGHSSVKTTETYVRMDSEQKRKALEAAAADIVPQSQTIEVWNDDEKLLNWLKGLGK